MSTGIRYLLATFGVIFLLTLGIVVFTRGDSQNAKTPDRTAIQLSDYYQNDDASVQYTIQGPITASETHRQIRITISPNSRQIDIIAGYEGNIIDRKVYDNNTDAYTEFLDALRRANFTKERRLDRNINSAAICPLGNRSYYQIIENNQDVMNLWSASCIPGSFAGNVQLTRQLFQLQIPDYNVITQSVSVGSTSSSNGILL